MWKTICSLFRIFGFKSTNQNQEEQRAEIQQQPGLQWKAQGSQKMPRIDYQV